MGITIKRRHGKSLKETMNAAILALIEALKNAFPNIITPDLMTFDSKGKPQYAEFDLVKYGITNADGTVNQKDSTESLLDPEILIDKDLANVLFKNQNHSKESNDASNTFLELPTDLPKKPENVSASNKKVITYKNASESSYPDNAVRAIWNLAVRAYTVLIHEGLGKHFASFSPVETYNTDSKFVRENLYYLDMNLNSETEASGNFIPLVVNKQTMKLAQIFQQFLLTVVLEKDPFKQIPDLSFVPGLNTIIATAKSNGKAECKKYHELLAKRIEKYQTFANGKANDHRISDAYYLVKKYKDGIKSAKNIATKKQECTKLDEHINSAVSILSGFEHDKDAEQLTDLYADLHNMKDPPPSLIYMPQFQRESNIDAAMALERAYLTGEIKEDSVFLPLGIESHKDGVKLVLQYKNDLNTLKSSAKEAEDYLISFIQEILEKKFLAYKQVADLITEYQKNKDYKLDFSQLQALQLISCESDLMTINNILSKLSDRKEYHVLVEFITKIKPEIIQFHEFVVTNKVKLHENIENTITALVDRKLESLAESLELPIQKSYAETINDYDTKIQQLIGFEKTVYVMRDKLLDEISGFPSSQIKRLESYAANYAEKYRALLTRRINLSLHNFEVTENNVPENENKKLQLEIISQNKNKYHVALEELKAIQKDIDKAYPRIQCEAKEKLAATIKEYAQRCDELKKTLLELGDFDLLTAELSELRQERSEKQRDLSEVSASLIDSKAQSEKLNSEFDQFKSTYVELQSLRSDQLRVLAGTVEEESKNNTFLRMRITNHEQELSKLSAELDEAGGNILSTKHIQNHSVFDFLGSSANFDNMNRIPSIQLKMKRHNKSLEKLRAELSSEQKIMDGYTQAQARIKNDLQELEQAFANKKTEISAVHEKIVHLQAKQSSLISRSAEIQSRLETIEPIIYEEMQERLAKSTAERALAEKKMKEEIKKAEDRRKIFEEHSRQLELMENEVAQLNIELRRFDTATKLCKEDDVIRHFYSSKKTVQQLENKILAIEAQRNLLFLKLPDEFGSRCKSVAETLGRVKKCFDSVSESIQNKFFIKCKRLREQLGVEYFSNADNCKMSVYLRNRAQDYYFSDKIKSLHEKGLGQFFGYETDAKKRQRYLDQLKDVYNNEYVRNGNPDILYRKIQEGIDAFPARAADNDDEQVEYHKSLAFLLRSLRSRVEEVEQSQMQDKVQEVPVVPAVRRV